MPLTKSKGNMYPWVTHTHTHLGGVCPHSCSYCYVQAMENRFGGGRYAGDLRLVEKEFKVNYGTGRIIFIEHCNDLFAEGVKDEWIGRILKHCRKYPDNEYVFQTKNPPRASEWLTFMPENRLIGCTVETDDESIVASDAPKPIKRINAMLKLSSKERTFITVEPILKCDGRRLASWVAQANPDFVNIGADSKGSDLDEPSKEEIEKLIAGLNEWGVEIRQKKNLERLLGYKIEGDE